MTWAPIVRNPYPIGDIAFQSRVRNMLRWIRKGESDKSAKSARAAAHIALALISVNGWERPQ